MNKPITFSTSTLVSLVVLPVLGLMGLLLAASPAQSESAVAAGPMRVAQVRHSPNSPNLPPNDPSILYNFVSVIDSGISQPIFITHAKDDRLFVVEQGGAIKIWQSNAVLSSAFLDISMTVKASSEEGLLGLAFEPNYASTGRFYVYYTNQNGDQNIARYTVSAGNPNVANALSATILMTIAHPTHGNHNGGWMGFGPDGFLYAAVGDGGGSGDPFCAAQNTNERRGKVLRLNVAGQLTYTTPATNTFTTTQLSEVWAIGLRNPWRNSFDRQTGDLYIGDVGQGSWEEISFVPAGASAGLNFGWSQREGRNDYSSSCPSSNIAATEPFTDYAHNSNGGLSVTGGYVYRGVSYPWLNGSYFFGDFSTGNVWAAWQPTVAGVFSTTRIATAGFSISSFGEDADGEIYLADYDSGRVLRLSSALITPTTATPTATITPTSLPDLKIGSMRISIQLDATGCYSSSMLGTYVTVQNSGFADAGPFSVTLNNLTLRVSNGLQVGQSTTLWFSSSNSDANAMADSGNEVTESDETNNTLSEILPIPTLPPPCKTVTPTHTPGPTLTRTPTHTPTRTPTLSPTPTIKPGPISPRVSLPLVYANSNEKGMPTPLKYLE